MNSQLRVSKFPVQAVTMSAVTSPLTSYCTACELLETRLDGLLPSAEDAPQPLHRAMRHSVFSGGKRLRPRLLIAVAAACGAESSGRSVINLTLNAACAVELIHSASLIHDDLPVFDDAPQRRGRPTVHVLYGEPLAILAGDALLSRAFEIMAGTRVRLAGRALAILRMMGAAVGSREGIIGGQSMEDPGPRPSAEGNGAESCVATPITPDAVDKYHAMKSAALFRLAASAGAVAAGYDNPAAWAEVGQCLGLALQIADDLYDVGGDASVAGKPVRRDAQLGRPNAALLHGQNATRDRLWGMFRRASDLASSLAVGPSPLTALLDQASSHFRLAAA